mgnify:CR=1 FL=1
MGENKKQEFFLNPYNFIAFPDKKAEAYTDKDCHTGVITYTLTTRTPVFIPNSSSDKAFDVKNNCKKSENKNQEHIEAGLEHKSYDFFSYTELDPTQYYNDKYHVPVIPGSEIRGVVRSVYETLTDSCMGVLNEDEHVVKRTSEAFKPGLLEKNGFKISLVEATSNSIGNPVNITPEEFKSYSNGQRVYYKKDPKRNIVTDYSFECKKNYNFEGYLLKWGMGVGKRRYHVYTRQNNGKKRVFSKDEIERKLLPVIHSYLNQPAVQEKNREAYQEYESNLISFLNSENETVYFPVNYSELKSGIIYLSPAVFTKEVSQNSVGDLAKEFAPCKGSVVCPACDLFGYVRGTQENSRSSKIRFTDLYVKDKKTENEDYYCGNVTLENLGSPKLANVEFYLKKPKDVQFWTYDYYIRSGKITIEPGELRGRKYYWHHRNVKLQSAEAIKLNKTIRPVKEGITFQGKLYFEGISMKQLHQLMWILNSGKDNLGLKIGTGKPLGLGSVSSQIDQVEERVFTVEDGQLQYEMKEIPNSENTYEEVGFSNASKEEFMKISGLENAPPNMKITYPKLKGDNNKGYEWYVKNHNASGMKQTRNGMVIHETLPSIGNEQVGLPYWGKNFKSSTKTFQHKGTKNYTKRKWPCN